MAGRAGDAESILLKAPVVMKPLEETLGKGFGNNLLAMTSAGHRRSSS